MPNCASRAEFLTLAEEVLMNVSVKGSRRSKRSKRSRSASPFRGRRVSTFKVNLFGLQ